MEIEGRKKRDEMSLRKREGERPKNRKNE